MMTAEQCRQILGKRAEGMTDEQIVQLHDALHGFANTLIDRYLFERNEAYSEQNDA